MSKFKRSGLVAVQVLVAVATVAATIVMFLHPACVEHMLAEVARGVAASLMLAGVNVSRPRMAGRPMWHYGWAVARHEFRCGLVGGYLLGLVLAMWACWNG